MVAAPAQPTEVRHGCLSQNLRGQWPISDSGCGQSITTPNSFLVDGWGIVVGMQSQAVLTHWPTGLQYKLVNISQP